MCVCAWAITGMPGEFLAVKFIRDRVSGLPSGFGFVEFATHGAASRVLSTLNGQAVGASTLLPNTILCRVRVAQRGVHARLRAVCGLVLLHRGSSQCGGRLTQAVVEKCEPQRRRRMRFPCTHAAATFPLWG